MLGRWEAAYLPHVAVPNGAAELDAILEEVLLAHLEEVDELGAVAACHSVLLRVDFYMMKKRRDGTDRR